MAARSLEKAVSLEPATGLRHIDMPATSEKVWRALGRAA